MTYDKSILGLIVPRRLKCSTRISKVVSAMDDNGDTFTGKEDHADDDKASLGSTFRAAEVKVMPDPDRTQLTENVLLVGGLRLA